MKIEIGITLNNFQKTKVNCQNLKSLVYANGRSQRAILLKIGVLFLCSFFFQKRLYTKRFLERSRGLVFNKKKHMMNFPGEFQEIIL